MICGVMTASGTAAVAILKMNDGFRLAVVHITNQSFPSGTLQAFFYY
jgi:hypothetical protein